MRREINLSGGEITLLKTMGLSGTPVYGKLLIERIGEMECEVDRQQQRESAEEKVLIQFAECAEPAKRHGEKNNAGEITE